MHFEIDELGKHGKGRDIINCQFMHLETATTGAMFFVKSSCISYNIYPIPCSVKKS